VLKQGWPVRSLGPRKGDRAEGFSCTSKLSLAGLVTFFRLISPLFLQSTFTHFYNEDRGSSFSETLEPTYIVTSVTVKVISVCIHSSLLPYINMKDAFFCYSVSHKCLKVWLLQLQCSRLKCLWNVIPICTNCLLIVQSFNLMSR
jgi:hypothetical protein